MRPWFAIHLEALKLFGKKLRFSRPEPAVKQHSLTSSRELNNRFRAIRLPKNSF